MTAKAGTLGSMSDDSLTWRDAALRVGEELASVGPNGYYGMTQVEWRDWALSVVKPVTASPAKTGEDLERDGTFAMIAEALGEPSAAPVEPLREALRKLANEASGFLSMADEVSHGHTNMAVLRQRISEAYAALNPVAMGMLQHAAAALHEHPVAVETLAEKERLDRDFYALMNYREDPNDDELSSDPRHIERPSGK